MRASTIALLLPGCLLAACSPSQPSGQVVARVDGEEITRRDLQVELLASGAPADVDLKSVQGALLDQIVTRKLLAQQARRAGIDRTPDYLATMRRDREVLLVNALSNRAYELARAPAAADIARFVADNKVAFDQRRLITVDRLEAATPSVPLATIKAAKSNDEVAALLKARGQTVRRDQVTIDTLETPDEPAASLSATAGRPAASYADGLLQVDMLLSSEPMPVPEEDRPALAKSLLLRARAADWVERETARLRANAQVEYQPSYGPRNARR